MSEMGAHPDRIMYWKPSHRPQDFLRRVPIAAEDRQAVIEFFKNGKRVQGWMGYANCRICGALLGTQDLGSDGFQWPERAEHYLEKHDVWTPGCDRVLRMLKGEKNHG